MQSAPKGIRLHIGVFGRRNVGKSSLLNALTRQNVSIVSDQPGTTTDPVEKAMELLPLGPVLLIDTAGIDDEGALGRMRIQKTQRVFDRTELGVVVSDGGWGGFEQGLVSELQGRETPLVVVFNKSDLISPGLTLERQLSAQCLRVVHTDALHGQGILDFRQALLDTAPQDFLDSRGIVSDLLEPGEIAVLVTPIDKEAPKGRLIVPQVQTIRDALDHGGCSMVVQDRDLPRALDGLKGPPKIVITDSQAFQKVAEDTPPSVLLTSFSILFARFKGDLDELVRGAMAIEALRPGDQVLVAEACSHHPIADDIGRVKIPRWLKQYVGGELEFHHVQGHDFPGDFASYRLVIHCAACVFNRREMLTRIIQCRRAGVPITNYGLAIAYSLGILERALGPFPSALEVYGNAKAAAR